MYLCCKQSVGLLFLCKGAFSREFLFQWICNWGFMKFSLLCVFSFYTFADVVVVSCLYHMCVVVSGCVLVWICDWFAKILVDVLKLSWHFGDRSLIFLLKVEFGCPFLERSCYFPPVICPLVIYCFHCWYYFFVDSNLVTIYLEVN